MAKQSVRTAVRVYCTCTVLYCTVLYLYCYYTVHVLYVYRLLVLYCACTYCTVLHLYCDCTLLYCTVLCWEWFDLLRDLPTSVMRCCSIIEAPLV